MIGGGNIFRGLAVAAKRRATGSRGDYMGMLATVMNSLALQHRARAQGPAGAGAVGHPHADHLRSLSSAPGARPLDAGRVVIFAGGTGNPFFTTDTAAALRAAEMGCDALFKATQVDGVYSADPQDDPNARRYDRSAMTMCWRRICGSWTPRRSRLRGTTDSDNCVFHQEQGGLAAVLQGKGSSTTIS